MPAINMGVTESHTGNPARTRKNVNTMAPAIAFDKKTGTVRVEFGQPVEWLEINPEAALGMALVLIKAAARGFTMKKNNHG